MQEGRWGLTLKKCREEVRELLAGCDLLTGNEHGCMTALVSLILGRVDLRHVSTLVPRALHRVRPQVLTAETRLIGFLTQSHFSIPYWYFWDHLPSKTCSMCLQILVIGKANQQRSHDKRCQPSTHSREVCELTQEGLAKRWLRQFVIPNYQTLKKTGGTQNGLEKKKRISLERVWVCWVEPHYGEGMDSASLGSSLKIRVSKRHLSSFIYY